MGQGDIIEVRNSALILVFGATVNYIHLKEEAFHYNRTKSGVRSRLPQL
jgi:hypothetical protein